MWQITKFCAKIIKIQKEAVKIKIKNIFVKPWILILISAVFSAAPLTFSSLFLLSWVSFVPLFYVFIKHPAKKLKAAFGRGFLFGFVYHACIYYWFLWFFPLEYVGLSTAPSIAVVCLAWFGISLVHGMLWCIPFVMYTFAQKLNKNPFFLCFVAVVGIVLTQKLTAVGELPFPWARISLGQYKATYLIQAASLFGIDGVDMLILFVNALITICIISPPKKRTVTAIGAAALFLTNLTFGLVKTANKPAESSLTVMTVQGSIPSNKKWSVDGIEYCLDTYSNLTKANITDNVQLILWPESAVPTLYYNNDAKEEYEQLAKDFDTPILVGVIQREHSVNTNDTLYIDKNGSFFEYSKRQLVPFGEYMPYSGSLSKLFPMLTELNIIENDYIAGQRSAVMQTEYGNFGNIICFESTYPNLSRQSTLDGAEILFELTNDSWLEDSPAMTQHLAHGVFRSVENGRYLVRSANSGVSAIIDQNGKIIKQLDANKTGVITDTVYLYDDLTFYTKTGDVLFPLCVGVLVILMIIFVIKNKRFAK